MKHIKHKLLNPFELGQSLDEAFTYFLKMKKKDFSSSIQFISGIKVTIIFYSVLLSYFVSSTVELATFTGFSEVLVYNLLACFVIICSQYFIGTIKGEESLKLGSRMDKEFVENISQLSFSSRISLTPRFVSFVKELRVARTESIPELLTTILGIISFQVFAVAKGAFFVLLPLTLVFLCFLLWTYKRRKEIAKTWDIQERLLERGLDALEESETESVEAIVDDSENHSDVIEYFRLKMLSFKDDFVTRSLIIFAAINAALMFSSMNHPDRIVLSTLGLFAAKMLQDAVTLWLDFIKTKEIAKSIKWASISLEPDRVVNSCFSGAFSFNDVSFQYSPQSAFVLSNWSFQLNEGETLTISGYSGSGKSTLLKLISGEIKPSIGKVEYAGMDTNSAPAGFYEVAGHSAYDSTFPNIKISLLFSWFPTYFDRREEILDCVGLSPEALDLSYFELSQGEKKKVSIAVALFQCKGIVVLDEPFSGFDENYAQRLAAKLRTLPYTKIITVTKNQSLSFKIS